MHTFGHPVRIDQITEICQKHHIPLIEDAAEALGSFYKGQHAGTFGDIGILSFNGNKPVTTGGGGMIITNDETFAAKAKHLTTTAKKPHPWEFFHDEVGYNYRMPNINAAVKPLHDPLIRHPGESRGPEGLEKTGYRLSPV